MRRMAFLIAVAVIAAFSATALTAAAQARALNVGSISNEPADEIKDWIGFVRHLAKQVASEGITSGKVIIASDEVEMARLLRDGKVDLYIDSPLVAIAVKRMAGSKMFMRRWKRGKAEYTSVVFARTDNPLASLKDLVDTSVAFQDSYSTSGYMLPRLAMAAAGLRMVPLRQPGSPVPAGSVGYVFSDKDENTVAWVLQRRVAAGATSRRDYERMNKNKTLKILFETDPVPRQIVSHRGGLSPTLVAKLREAMAKMHLTEVGKKVLMTFEQTSQFDMIPADSARLLTRLEARIHEITERR